MRFAEDNNIAVIYPDDFGVISPAINSKTLFVAIGGDGTMLHTMDESIKFNTDRGFPLTSVVGFNAGTLGFLTEDPNRVQPQQMLTAILNGDEGVDCHNMLALSTTINGTEHFALNEITFTPATVSHPLNYSVRINDSLAAEHMGSGCMVATAMGSTAMSMSAGGAIVSPLTDVMQFVPIIPHTLSSRPIVTAGTDVITISSDMARVDEVIVSADGRGLHWFEKNATITIKKADMPVKVWYTARRDFFNVLTTKLGW